MEKKEIVKRVVAGGALAHDVAESHSGLLFDITCQAPKCGHRVSHYFIEMAANGKSRPEDDLRFYVCPKCLCKGLWSYVPTPEATVEEKDAALKLKAEAEVKQNEAKAKSLQESIAEMQAQLDALIPQKPFEALKDAEPAASA